MDILNNTTIMMPENIVSLISTITKVTILVLVLFYLFSAFLLTRRVNIMNTNFKTPAAPFFTLMALVNLLASLFVMTVTLLTLIK